MMRDKITYWASIVGGVSVILGGITGGVVFGVDKFLRPAWAEDIDKQIVETLEKQSTKFESINRDLTLQSNALREQGMADARTEAQIKALEDAIQNQTRLIELLIQKVD